MIVISGLLVGYHDYDIRPFGWVSIVIWDTADAISHPR